MRNVRKNTYKTSTYSVYTYTVRDCNLVRIGVFAQPRPFAATEPRRLCQRVTCDGVADGAAHTYTRAHKRTVAAPCGAVRGAPSAAWTLGPSCASWRPDGAVAARRGGVL